MIKFTFNKEAYYMDDEKASILVAQDIEKYKIHELSFDIECYSDNKMINKIALSIPFYMIEDKIESITSQLMERQVENQEELNFLELENQILKDEEELIRKNILLDEQKEELIRKEDEINNSETKANIIEKTHKIRVQKKLTEKIRLEDIRKTATDIIKHSFVCNIRMFECSNGIVMDGDIKDAINLENGILYMQKIKAASITIADYYNNDHVVSLSEAQKMSDEIEDGYYKARTLKQELYNQIKNSTDESKILDIRFKL